MLGGLPKPNRRDKPALADYQGALPGLNLHAVMRAANAVETAMGISAQRLWKEENRCARSRSFRASLRGDGCRANVEKFPAADGRGRTVLGSERGVTRTAGLTGRDGTALGLH